MSRFSRPGPSDFQKVTSSKVTKFKQRLKMGGTNNPLVHLRDLKDRVVVRLCEIEKVLETNNPVSTSELQAKIGDLDRA